MSNLAALAPSEFKKLVVPQMIAQLTRGIKLPPAMLWGPMGVGKSDVVRQIATEVGSALNRKTHVEDVRLLLFNPIDLRGMPVADLEKQLAVWLKPKIFNFDPSPDVVNYLLLDEITSAPTSVQAAAYQLTLDRKVGEHELPGNVIIICAGNRMGDKGVVNKMPAPLANRLTHYEICAKFAPFKEHAIKHDIHPLVLGFLSFKEDLLFKFDPKSESHAFPTPRSWMFTSTYLQVSDGRLDDIFPTIEGTIGSGAAIELKAFAETYLKLPSMQDIKEGKRPSFPKNNPGIVYALISALTIELTRSKGDEIKNILDYVISNDDISVDFQVKAVRDFSTVPNTRMAIVSSKNWSDWSKKNGILLQA